MENHQKHSVLFLMNQGKPVFDSLSRNTVNLTDARNRVVVFVSDEPLLTPELFPKKKKKKEHMDEITLLLSGISL